jgi:hypothetical protein
MRLDIGIELKNTIIMEKKFTMSEFLISHKNSKWPNGPLWKNNIQAHFTLVRM